MIRITLAQLNLRVGDISGNTKHVLETIKIAKKDHASDLLIFPELTLTGYPPEDLLLRPALYQQLASAMDALRHADDSMGILIGHPRERDGVRYNSCSLIYQGQQITYDKCHLPNYGVFDEKRYFAAGQITGLMQWRGIHIACSICEDLWHEQHTAALAKQGAKLLININASPYHTEKQAQREALLKKRSTDNHLPIIYVNLVGGQDELVFDGRSMAINAEGQCIYKAPAFRPDLQTVIFNTINNSLRTEAICKISPPPPKAAEIYQAIVLGIQDYAKKNHFHGAILGLSGGIDSALTLCLAVDALGAEQITVLLMPSRYSSQMSIEDAQQQASIMGVTAHIIDIEQPFTAFISALAPVLGDAPAGSTYENIQARCRGVLLMALSNQTGKLLLTTGNKSELAVGYTTLYGDMAGGFAPLKDVSKTLVYELARWRNSEQTVIPQRVIHRPPSAELRDNQRDDDNLPPYEVLDPILAQYIEQQKSAAEICAAGFATEIVHMVIKLVDNSEYKRRQAPPGVRITAQAFGRERRYPISSQYDECATHTDKPKFTQ